MRTVGGRRSRAVSWSAITSNLLPVPALSIVHHQLLPTTAGNGCHLIQELDWLDSSIASQDEVNLLKGYLTCGWILPAIVMTPYVIYKQVNFMVLNIWGIRCLYIPSYVSWLTSFSKYILDRPCISFDLSADIHFLEVGFTFQWIWYVLSSLSGWMHDYFIWIASFTCDATQAFTIFFSCKILHLAGKYWL